MTFPSTYNFSYYRGDRYELVINPKNANGTTFDLSDYDSLFVIATSRGSASASVLSASPTVDSSAGTVTAIISPTNGRNYLSAGPYLYDIQISRGGSAVYTLLTGTISVTQDISDTGGS
jgi:hypothetical protein